MNKIAKLGAVLGLVALGGCVDPYGNYETSYYGGYGAGPYDNGPVRYDNYYGPDYYADRPYYGGGGYRAYNPGQRDGGYRRGDRDGNRDAYRGANRDPNRDSNRDGRRDARPDGQASQRPQQQRPQQQAQPQWQPQPGVSARSQIFGGGGNAAPQAAPAPSSSGWNGFQGRNPNDPNNTD